MLLKRFWDRIFHRNSLPAGRSGGLDMESVIRTLNDSQSAHLSCDEVFELIDQYAEYASRGEKIHQLMPLVHAHLEACPECREQYDALMRVLAAE
jgi:anti-sigma factor ChrR (cupin superfamily)